MGGVLVDLDLEGCRNSFKENLGFEEIDKILDPCHQKGIYGDMEEGLITAEEFIATVLASSRPDAKAEGVMEAVWKILVDIAPYKVDPHSPVIIPTERIIRPIVCNSVESATYHITRIIPYTPVLIITPDMIAETCDGAAG